MTAQELMRLAREAEPVSDFGPLRGLVARGGFLLPVLLALLEYRDLTVDSIATLPIATEEQRQTFVRQQGLVIGVEQVFHIIASLLEDKTHEHAVDENSQVP